MELVFIRHLREFTNTKANKSLPWTHSELMRDGTPDFTLRLNGLLTFDLSMEVGLRWNSLSEETSRALLAGIWASHMCFFSTHPETKSCSKMATVALALMGSNAFWSLVLRRRSSGHVLNIS